MGQRQLTALQYRRTLPNHETDVFLGDKCKKWIAQYKIVSLIVHKNFDIG